MTVNDKAAALGKLYDRVMRIAKEMGGTATHQVRALTVPVQMTAAHQSENAPALIAEMPEVALTCLDDALFGELTELKTPSGLLALIELPLAGYSLFIASGEVGSWPDRRQMRPVGGEHRRHVRLPVGYNIAAGS